MKNKRPISPEENSNYDNEAKKQQLINDYRDNYNEIYFRSFLELSTTKLNFNNINNPSKITNSQLMFINNLLQNPDINREDFISALNVLTYEQIGYVVL